MQAAPLPKVSVVTICLNPGGKLDTTLRSVLDQQGVEVESIVIDGGSTDAETQRVLDRWQPRLGYLQSRRDGGISDALNQGIDRCRGDWIVPMNAGDTFIASDSLVRFFPETDTSDWNAAPIRSAFARFGAGRIPKRPVDDRTPLPRRALISHQATLVHREVYAAVGRYDPRYRLRMDLDFWLRALPRFSVRFIPEVLVDYEEGGLSGRHAARFFREELTALHAHLRHPWPELALSGARYAARTLLGRGGR